MKLYIFDKSEQLQAVLANEANACPFWDAVHDEKLNGENTFSFSMPADREETQYVIEGSYAAFQDVDGYWQLFEIKQVFDTHNENGAIREVFAEHAYYELVDDVLTDVRPYNVSAAFALQQALQNSRWAPGNVDNLGTNSVNFYYETTLSAVQKVANTWGGELQFRVDIVNGKITTRYVDLLAQRGAVTGKRFEYTKDIMEIKRSIDTSNIITACYGRGKGEEIGTTDDGKTTYGRRLTFADVVWTTPTNPVNKPAGQEWVGDDTALAQWGRNGRHRFGIFLDDNETDPAVLLQKTWDYLQANKTPRITYSLSVLDLERLSGYEHEAVRLGDTVNIIDKAFSPAIELSARVIEIKRNLLLPENTEIVLGNFAPTLADSLTQQQQVISNVRDRQGVWDRATQFNPDGTLDTSWLAGIIDTLRNQVNAGAGTVTITNDNGILITDSATNPTKALRLLGGIFAIANSKNPDGTWNWRTFGTGDGFTADEINAGQIRTSLIKIFGSSQFYWDGDNIYVINPANSLQQIRIGKYDGTNYGIAFTTDGGTTWETALNFGGLYIGPNTAQFASGYDPSTKETPEGAQQKANTAQSNAEAYANQILQSLANGSYTGGTFINGTSIISPVIGGNYGVFTGSIRVGTDGPIIIDGVNKKITINADNYIDATGIHVSGANVKGTLVGNVLSGVTVRATSDVYVGRDIYLYGDYSGAIGGAVYFGVTDPAGLAPYIYGYPEGTNNNLDIEVGNGYLYMHAWQVNVNSPALYVSGDIYGSILYTNRISGQTSGNQIYLGTGNCRIDTSSSVLRMQQSPTNYLSIGTDGTVTIYVGGTAKHAFYANGTKLGGSIVIDNINYGLSPIDSPEFLIADIMRNVNLVEGDNEIMLDDKTAKILEGYFVFFENSDGLTVTAKNLNSFIVHSSKNTTTDILIIGNRIGYKDVRWVEMTGGGGA